MQAQHSPLQKPDDDARQHSVPVAEAWQPNGPYGPVDAEPRRTRPGELVSKGGRSQHAEHRSGLKKRNATAGGARPVMRVGRPLRDIMDAAVRVSASVCLPYAILQACANIRMLCYERVHRPRFS